MVKMPLTLESIIERYPHCNHVCMMWVDYSGILRSKCISMSYAIELRDRNATFSTAQVSMSFLVNSSVIERDIATPGKHEIWPDWSSVYITPYGTKLGSIAGVMCRIGETSAMGTTTSFQRCPRTKLMEVCEIASSTFGISTLLGTEVEFTLVHENKDGTFRLASDHPGYWSAATFRHSTFPIIQEILDTYQVVGIPIHAFHSEGSLPGQHEISFAPLPAIKAIDTVMQAQEIIKTVAQRHGYIATMFPKPLANWPPNGLHVHMSINPPTKESCFLAGLMKRLDGLVALGMPSYDSYMRAKEFNAGSALVYGTQNRDAPVRRIRPGHWELRFMDATANIYIFITMVLSAGLSGIVNNEDLSTWRDVSSITDPSELKGEIEKAIKMPTSLRESLDNLHRRKTQLCEFTGPEILERYLEVREFEHARMSPLSFEKRVNHSLNFF